MDGKILKVKVRYIEDTRTKKIFKLKRYDRIDNEWKNIRNLLDVDGIVWGSVFGVGITFDEYETFTIYDYIPEKHDSIINELILKYG